MMDLSDYAGKRICAAVSGGADSTALLHFLKTKAEAYGFLLSAVNCEHGIRGEESLGDTRFVEELCKEWNIPLFLFRADCPAEAKQEKTSLETAARNFRYRCFQNLLNEGKTDFIAIAHHLDDEAETVLFRLARGASLTGAKGMEPRRGAFLRPFLDLTKREILAYVRENALAFCEDRSNADTGFARNRLRLNVLPELEKAVPGASGNLVRFARIAAEDDALLYELSESLIVRGTPRTPGDTGYRLRLDRTEAEKSPLFKRACLTVLKELGVEKDYTSLHLESVARLRRLQTGSKATLPKGLEARRIYDEIVFYRLAAWEKLSESGGEVPFGEGRFGFGDYEIVVARSSGEICPEKRRAGNLPYIQRAELLIDGDAVPENAVFRLPREGDVFGKFGGGRKSLKKYLTDKKIPADARANRPILAEREGHEVFVVCGVEIADCVKIAAGTLRPMTIVLNKTKEEKDQ